MKIKMLILASFCLALSGCGYGVVGYGSDFDGAPLIEKGRTMTISPVVNRADVIGVESILTSDLIGEFDDLYEIRPSGGDYLIEATLAKYDLKAVSFSTAEVIEEKRLTVTVSVVLKDSSLGPNAATVINRFTISDNDDFKVDVIDIALTEYRELEAFKNISSSLARDIRDRLLTGM